MPESHISQSWPSELLAHSDTPPSHILRHSVVLSGGYSLWAL
jgi:hypothetical protein